MRNLSAPNTQQQVARNRFGIKDTRQKPGAFRWWEPECTPGVDEGCTGEEPPLENFWVQPVAPLEKFAFRLHADGSLEFKGHLNAFSADSGTVAVTLPGAFAGEVSFLPANDQFFLTVVYDGATPLPAMVYVTSATGEVIITFPV